MALKIHESAHVGDPRHLVLFDHAPGALLSLYARFLSAYDPHAILPRDFPYTALAAIKSPWTTLTALEQAFGNAAVTKTLDTTMAGIDTNVLAVVGRLSVKAFQAGDSTPLKGLSGIKEALERLAALSGDAYDQYPSTRSADVDAKYSGIDASVIKAAGLDGELIPAQDLVLLTLAFRANALTKSTLLSSDLEVPMGSDKRIFTMATLARRLLTVLAVARHGVSTMALRELVSFVEDELNLKHLDTSDRVKPLEEVKDAAAIIRSIPIHPWLAEAERLAAPANRYTPWYDSSRTTGLARGGLFRVLEAVRVSKATGGGSANAYKRLLTTVCYYAVVRESKRLLDERNAMVESELSASATLLGYVTQGKPTPSVELHLHGETLNIYVAAGGQTNKAMPSILARMVSRVVPSSEVDGSRKHSRAAALHEYDAAGPAATGNAELFTREVPMYVTPHHPEADKAFILGTVSPQSVRAKDDHNWFGDDSAIEAPATEAGIREIVGSGPTDAEVLEVLARVNPNKVAGMRVFISNQTREVWRRRVELPLNARPQSLIALLGGGTLTASPINAYIGRTAVVEPVSYSEVELGDTFAANLATSSIDGLD